MMLSGYSSVKLVPVRRAVCADICPSAGSSDVLGMLGGSLFLWFKSFVTALRNHMVMFEHYSYLHVQRQY